MASDHGSGQPEPTFLFVDEAGNTGANLLDLDQPFAVVAGVLLPSSTISRAEALVDSVRRALPSPPNELKGSRLLKYSRGVEATNRLVHQAIGLGACLGVEVSEKRYVIGARAIDMFLDGALNPLAPSELLSNARAKQEIAEEFMRLPDSLIERVWTALREPNRDGLLNAIDGLAQQVTLLGHGHLGRMIAGARRGVDAIIAELQEDPHLFGPWTWGLHGLLAWADRKALERGSPSVHVIHDALESYEEALHLSVEYMQQATGEDWIANTGMRVPGRLRLVSDMAFADSKTAPLVQLADVTAALALDAAVAAGASRRARRRPAYAHLVAHAASDSGHLNVVGRHSLARLLVL